ncbi:MAG TPA: SDR family NAD(P)-dependent oxidoreductase [Steroidobacteraceae bacterium]|nr:SDR family NAD(P)-dependent oxidoreductase [Steroidobacteraceae bacterium]
MRDLRGKVALVTGGSSGIGLGIVKVLAEEGMKVAFTYRREDHLEEALGHFRGRSNAAVEPVKLDVTDRAELARAAERIEAALGPVQVLVNNAGVAVHGLIEHATYEDWDWILGVNLGGVVNGVATFLPRMIASGLEGHIVNVSSMGGIAALGSVGLYATSKFAVVGLTEALRTDMIGRKIGVSVYCPGPVKSHIGESGRGRPAHLARTGYTSPALAQGAPPAAMLEQAMDAVVAGRYVLEGIRENRLYILSHPEFRDVLAARHAAILAAVPDEPINEARAESIRFILSNPIYDRGA